MDGESTSECSGRGGGCPAGPLMRPNALYHKQLVIHRAVCQTLGDGAPLGLRAINYRMAIISLVRRCRRYLHSSASNVNIVANG